MASQSSTTPDPGRGLPPVGRAASADKPGANDPEVLAAEIEKTREDLAETLDAIADKVSPKRVTQRAKKKVADAARTGAADASDAVKDKASGAGESVKEAVGAVKEKASGAVASLKDKGKGGPDADPGLGADHDGSASSLSSLDTLTPSGAPGPALHPVAVASASVPVPAKPGSLVNVDDAGQGRPEPARPTSSAPSTTPYRPVPLDPPPSRLPMMAGAAAAVAVVLLLLRRRRR